MAEWVPPSSRVGIDFAEPGMATMRRKFEEPVSSQYNVIYQYAKTPLYFFKKNKHLLLGKSHPLSKHTMNTEKARRPRSLQRNQINCQEGTV